MNVETVCTLLIDALKDAGYKDSTIFNNQRAVGLSETLKHSVKNKMSLNTAMKSVSCMLMM